MRENMNAEYDEWLESLKWWRLHPKSKNNGYNKCGVCKYFNKNDSGESQCPGDELFAGITRVMHLSEGCEFFEYDEELGDPCNKSIKPC